MFKQIVLAGFLICLASGCGKKVAKNTGSSDTPPPSQQTASNDKGKPGDKNDKSKKDGDKPNWLGDPKYKKDSSGRQDSGDESDGLPGKPGLGGMKLTQPPGGWAEGGKQGSIAPVSNTPQASPVSEADMKELWVFVDNRAGSTGQMPSKVDIQSALRAARSNAAELIKDGSIVLTGATARDSVWAHEKKALTQGGWVASQNGVENLTAAQLASRLSGR
jgi:hypothetical protein